MLDSYVYFPLQDLFLTKTCSAVPQSFRDMVALCLVKDQTKRPTAEKLLKHSFFKNAKPPAICVKKLFADLPPLWTRVKDLQVFLAYLFSELAVLLMLCSNS